mgnify:CR=1 FL=1|tara:strand:+ start:1422 stop:1706 length:285 start_codon:yes stop_codon:yes gene_type:complete
MPKALWNGVVIAESEIYETVEGNIYFPAASLKLEHFKPSTETSFCPWKGTASYFDVEAGGKTSAGAAWYYPDPKPEAEHIKGHVAFWRGVDVVD